MSGCLSQRYRKELPKLMPEVDAFMGIDQVEEVGNIVRKAVRNRSSRVAEAIPQQDRDSAEVDKEEKDPVNDQVALKDNTNEETNIFV